MESRHWKRQYPNLLVWRSLRLYGFNLNVVKLVLEKPLNAEESWAAGYKADLGFGLDANLMLTQSTEAYADFGIKQAYVALRAPVGNGLDFKVAFWSNKRLSNASQIYLQIPRGHAIIFSTNGRLAQLVRARGSHPRGHRFDSYTAHSKPWRTIAAVFLVNQHSGYF